jgi:hypothetical protein
VLAKRASKETWPEDVAILRGSALHAERLRMTL